MSLILYQGKPKLAKEYGGTERVWHLYQGQSIDGHSWSVRLCDRLNARLVYMSNGKPVRVCKKCLAESVK